MSVFIFALMVIWLSVCPAWATTINLHIEKNTKKALDKIFEEYDGLELDSFEIEQDDFKESGHETQGSNEEAGVDKEDEEDEEDSEDPIEEKYARFIRVYLRGELLGYVYCGIEYGKHKNMYFKVAIDRSGKVIKVIVTDAGSPRGVRTRSQRFLRQFRGKSADKKIVFGRNINGVTGATFSSRAVTRGVIKATRFWVIFYNKNI